MIQWIDLLNFAFAAWRLSVFVTMERGPFDVMVRIRSRFGVVHDDFGDIVSNPASGMGKLLACHWCFSFWAVIIVVAIAIVDIRLVYLLGIWGMVGAIQALAFPRR